MRTIRCWAKKGEKLPLAGVDEKDLVIVCEGGYASSFNLAVRRLRRGLGGCWEVCFAIKKQIIARFE